MTSENQQKVVDMNIIGQSELRQCRNCFMTGKPCINQREITGKIGKLEKDDKGKFLAATFVLMPFRPLMDQIYWTQLRPCLETIFNLVNRADDITMTGYVICEKICKEIQGSRLVCAELSSNNHNVFYELGLAFALRRGVTLLVQEDLYESRKNILNKLNILENEVTKYKPFDMITKEELVLKSNQYKPVYHNRCITILLADMSYFNERIEDGEFQYRIDNICKSAIHRCLDRIDAKLEMSLLKGLDRKTVIIRQDSYFDVAKKATLSFAELQDHIENSDCIFVCTSEEEPCSYFWLGYAHGLDKVVIPVSVHSKSEETSEDSKKLVAQHHKETFLPFDVRALWHIYFSKDKIGELEKQVDNILNIIAFKDKERTNRKRFWNRVLEPGQVSIFVGAVELTKNNRHVVGEWDYRAVSELTNFVTSIKETTETIIQTPTIQISQQLLKTKNDDELLKYIKDSKDRLKEKNSIVIASADVNDMTEVALSEVAGTIPFSPLTRNSKSFYGLVAFKEQPATAQQEDVQRQDPPQYVYYELIDKSGGIERRGFKDYTGGTVNEQSIYQKDYELYSKSTSDISEFFAYVCKYYFKETDRQVIVLQGITGPATLGVVQAVTGAKNKQFTIYHNKKTMIDFSSHERNVIEQLKSRSASFNEYSTAEDIGTVFDRKSEEITAELENVFTENSSVEALLKIYVMNDQDITHDARKILWWEYEITPRAMRILKK